jgi:hypothetical protein
MLLCSQSAKGFRFINKEPDVKTFAIESSIAGEDDEDLLGFRNLSDEKIANRAEKRFNQHLIHPCGCHLKEKRIDFGKGSYPRFHFEKTCDHEKIQAADNHCRLGSECKEQYTNILLLKYKTDLNDGSISDLPRELRDGYFWERREIAIDCRCTFPKKA